MRHGLLSERATLTARRPAFYITRRRAAEFLPDGKTDSRYSPTLPVTGSTMPVM
jgi:hypothetical protein